MENTDIAIIGGGPIGLVALYECKIRNIRATLYERENNIGGVWNLNSSRNRAHKSTVFNTSSFLSSYKLDFPLFQYLNNKYPGKLVDYPSISDFNEYLNAFIKYYELESMIILNKEITEIITEQNEPKFSLKVTNRLNGQEELYCHKYVIVVAGNFANPIVPPEPFLSRHLPLNADGVWHSSHWDPLDSGNVAYGLMSRPSMAILVVGSGPSAGEVLQDTIRKAKTDGNYEGLRIFWAPTREPDKNNVWIVDFYPYKERNVMLTADEIYSRLFGVVPDWVTRREMKKICTNIIQSCENANPDKYRDRICICDCEIINEAIRDGFIIILSNAITKIYKSGSNQLFFDAINGRSIPVDHVIIGLGYTASEPKINGEYILKNSRFIRNVIPLDQCLDGRIGFIATIAVRGSSLALGQMEIKWLLYQWFDKNSNLEKTLEKMRLQNLSEVSEDNVHMKKEPGKLMDEYAKDMNVMPDIWRGLLNFCNRQRHLALACMIGPWSIYQYKDHNETETEKRRRENIILSSTENIFNKYGKGFRRICFVCDAIYFATICAIVSFVYILCKYLV